MFATYNATNPGKNTLNIREAPGGAVIDTMADGQTTPVEVIERGWCKLDNGYADARFLTITAEPPAGDGNDAAELRKMTNPQLYKLAQDSGIKVKAGMNKDALVEAILAGADD